MLVKRILTPEEIAKERAMEALELNGIANVVYDSRYSYDSMLQAASSTFIKPDDKNKEIECKEESL